MKTIYFSEKLVHVHVRCIATKLSHKSTRVILFQHQLINILYWYAES